MPIRTSNPKPDPGNPVGFWRPKTQVDRWARAEMVTRADTGGIQLLHFQWLTNAEKNVIVSSSKNSSKRIVSNKRINKFKKSRRCETMLQVWWD